MPIASNASATRFLDMSTSPESKFGLLRSAIWFSVASFFYILIFSRRTDVMSGDAQLSAMLSNYQISGFGKTFALRSDPLFGAGSLQGGFLFWLDPVSVIGSIGSSIYNHFLVAFVTSVVVFVLAAKLYEALAVSKSSSVISAGLTAIATLWGYSVALVDNELFGHVPQYGSLMMVSLAVLCCFTRINGESPRRDSIYIFGFFISIAMLFVVLPHLLITSVPLLVFVGLISLITLLRERRFHAAIRRSGVLLATILLLLFLKAPSFLQGFYLYTAASELPLSTYTQPQLWPLHKFIFQTFFPTPSAAGNHLFQIVCFFALGSYVLRGVWRKQVRSQVWFIAVIAAVFLLVYRLWQSTWDFESGPRVSYFIWMLAPVYAVATVESMSDLARSALAQLKGTIARRGAWLKIVAGGFVALVLFASPLTSLRFSLTEPPARSLDSLRAPKFLTEQVALFGDVAFRGRVAYVLQDPDYPKNISGRIPLLNEYSHTLTPSAFRFYERFLLDDDSPQSRNRLVLGVKNFDIYRALGVRFLVAPKDRFDSFKSIVAGSGLVATEFDEQNLLIDLGQPNLGTYSPTVLQFAGPLRQVFDLIENQDLDMSRSVVVEKLESFVPTRVSEAEMSFSGGDILIKAKSAARSIILLPVEFSSCWKIKNLGSPNNDASLIRANGFLTGLIFTKEIEAEIILRNGLFDNPTCRKADLEQFRSLSG